MAGRTTPDTEDGRAKRGIDAFVFSSRRRHTRFALVSWARNVYKRQVNNTNNDTVFKIV